MHDGREMSLDSKPHATASDRTTGKKYRRASRGASIRGALLVLPSQPPLKYSEISRKSPPAPKRQRIGSIQHHLGSPACNRQGFFREQPCYATEAVTSLVHGMAGALGAGRGRRGLTCRVCLNGDTFLMTACPIVASGAPLTIPLRWCVGPCSQRTG